MAKLRDKIIHHYMGVDYETVWNIMKNEIPELEKNIKQILKEHNKQ